MAAARVAESTELAAAAAPDPKSDPRSCFEQATERFNAGREVPADAVACLRTMEPTDPYAIGAMLLVARVAERAGDRSGARAALNEALEHPRGRGDLEVYELLARIEASEKRWGAVRDTTEKARGLRPRRGTPARKAQLNLSVAELLATAYRRLAASAVDPEERKDLRRRAVDAYTRLFDLADETGDAVQRKEAETRLRELRGDESRPGLFGGG